MAVKRISIFAVLFLAACSWEYHRSHLKVPTLNPQPGEYRQATDQVFIEDSIACLRSQFYILKGNWRYTSSCTCENDWQIDSAFRRNGQLFSLSKHHSFPSSHYLYDSAITILFDKDERPVQRSIYINQPDTNYQYWQYYDKFGQPEKAKHPVIYQLLNE
ncbi:hypothetical protein [Croceimicrobium sp.]|uniref:hypothetical protein n=1 Tax=Croceimicrobium sp. TaxID=2828340 RepID=UPI003BAA9166